MKNFFYSVSLLLLPTIGFAQSTWYVDQSGNGDFTSIQKAINTVPYGDIVIVRDGTYFENLEFNYAAVILRSENGPASTIIDGSQAGPVIWFTDWTDDAVVDGFTITNGRSTNGGGIECRFGDTSPTIINNVISQNTALWHGGGIYFEDESHSLISGNTISGNVALAGDGGGVYGGFTAVDITLTNNTIFDNVSQGSGGGIFFTHSSPTISGNTIFENSATQGKGGGLCISSPGAWHRNIIVEDNSFLRNHAEGSGGGIAIVDISAASSGSARYITGNIIQGNSSMGDGGGIFLEESSLRISQNEVSYNSSGGDAGGIYCYWFSSPLIDSNLLLGNVSLGFGGAISCKNQSDPFIDRVTAFGNLALKRGGGLHCRNNSNPTITNSIFWENAAPKSAEFYFDAVSPTVLYSDVKGGWAGVGNIDSDPIFVSGFYLSQTSAGQVSESPCIDAGDPSSSLPSTTTRTDGVLDSLIVDMGYHHQGPPSAGPTLVITNLISGQVAKIGMSQCTPYGKTVLAYSLAGGGPINTPYGPGYVSKPYQLLNLTCDSNGDASLTQLVPSGMTGTQIWFHGADLGTATMLNPIAATIY